MCRYRARNTLHYRSCQPRTATFYNLLTPTPIPGQLIEQPVVCRHGDAAGAPDLVCLTAQTAFGSGFFNEIFRCVDLIAECQYVVFAAQMRLRLYRDRKSTRLN